MCQMDELVCQMAMLFRFAVRSIKPLGSILLAGSVVAVGIAALVWLLLAWFVGELERELRPLEEPTSDCEVFRPDVQQKGRRTYDN